MFSGADMSAKSFCLWFVSTLLLSGLVACERKPNSGQVHGTALESRPQPAAQEREPGCPMPPGGWLATPSYGPAPSPNPDDCFFYTAAWQNFVDATKSDAGAPAFLGYPNIASVFGATASAKTFASVQGNSLSVAVRDLQRPNSLSAPPSRLVSIGDGVRQAGGLAFVVVDGNGDPVYYSIHVNTAFSNFIKQNGLTTRAQVEKNPDLEFPPGVAEFKAAWVVTPDNDPSNFHFLLAKSSLPLLSQDAQGVVRTTGQLSSKMVTLKLVALHVAFVIKDHPEFIWATFEHQDGDDTTDLSPSAVSNDQASPINLRSGMHYILLAPTATRATANIPCPGVDADQCNAHPTYPILDPVSQTFMSGGKPQQTSVFREFPGSKSDRDDEDDSVGAVNTSLRVALGADARSNYRLVGATWLENPRDTPQRKGDFATGKSFRNPPNQNTEDRSRVVAGEDALSSTAMESFTQRDDTGCFSCHNTKEVDSDENNNPTILNPTRLNVSHIISRYLSNPK
jgi:hypothetical protein